MVANSNSEANEYFRELIAWETDGDRSPIQTDPDPAVLDETTPMLLRRQAA